MISRTAPTITPEGITAPTLGEIIEFLEQQYRNVFGPDIYIDSDSQDGQLIGILAAAINDSNAAAIEVYNAFSPSTAQDAGLSSVVKINGIRRQPATNTTVDLVLTGRPGTTITQGVVTGPNNNRWNLPNTVVIGTNGSVTATATCQTSGAVPAEAGTINLIATPTRGWQSVTNPNDGSPGRDVELDGSLRQRQTASVALPSQSVLSAITGAVANVEGVTRYRGYDNPTAAENDLGIAPYTLSVVVEGGDAQRIAEIIASKKTLGTPTQGDVTVPVEDEQGEVTNINFYRPSYVDIQVQVNIEALGGYLSVTGDQIRQTVADYINARGIGRDVVRTRLFVPANLSNDVATNTFEVNNVQLAEVGGTLAEQDIALPAYGRAQCDVEDVTVVIDQ